MRKFLLSLLIFDSICVLIFYLSSSPAESHYCCCCSNLISPQGSSIIWSNPSTPPLAFMALVIQMLGVQDENCMKHYMSIWTGLKWPQDVRVDMKYRRGGVGDKKKNHWLVCSGWKKIAVVLREKWPITKRPQVTLRLYTEGWDNTLMVP